MDINEIYTCMPCKISTRALHHSGYPGLHKPTWGHYTEHRLVYALSRNYTFKPGDVVMHRCDNKRCIEPTHLVLGTQQDNIKDMIKKGRHKKGLTDEQVVEIRRRFDSGEGIYFIAKEMNVTTHHIWKIGMRYARRDVQ